MVSSLKDVYTDFGQYVSTQKHIFQYVHVLDVRINRLMYSF